jgi:hypothetical protein
MYAKVKQRVIDSEGIPVGIAHNNPSLDMRQYEVELLDGTKEVLFANTIAENLFAQVDDKGNCHVLFHDITDHQKRNVALTEDEAIEILPNRFTRRKPTTKGWEILVTWKDGSTNWITL